MADTAVDLVLFVDSTYSTRSTAVSKQRIISVEEFKNMKRQRSVTRRTPLRPGSVSTVQNGRGDRLCVLALPADMGVAEFCSFVGAYLPQIKEMRLVRREGGRTACMVLLRFMSKSNADEFYLHFNNKPVC